MTIELLIGWTLSVVVALFLGKGALDKVRGTQEMVSNFAYMKLERYRIPTGLGELLAAILLLVPVTSLYGMVLICSFMSAAVALHLSLMGGNKKELPALVALAAILGYVLRTL